jgi:hypothetical protein
MWKGSIYDIQSASTGATVSSGALPVLQSLISAAGQVGAKYLEVSAVKEQAKAQAEVLARLRAQQATMIPTRIDSSPPPSPVTKIAGIEWPIWAIIGIGAFIVIRGKKKETPKRKRR